MAYFRPILLGLQTIVPLHLVEKLLAHYPHADLQSCATRHIRVSCNGADAGRYLCSEIHFVTETIPTLDTIDEEGQASFKKSLKYMGFKPGEKLLGHKIDYVFLGACTNGRIEDFRAFASIVKGKHKAEGVTAWLVPGSWLVDKQIREEGIDKIVEAAGFEIRQPGCSACLAMNDDKIPAGKYSVSTSNRNFEGRQGPGSRTILASPLVAAAAAVTGVITDPREFM